MSDKKLTKKERETTKKELNDHLRKIEFMDKFMHLFKVEKSPWEETKKWWSIRISPEQELGLIKDIVDNLSVKFSVLNEGYVYFRINCLTKDEYNVESPVPYSSIAYNFQFYLFRNGRKYTFYTTWGGNFGIRESSTEEEIEKKRKTRETDYAIIERNGKKALVKFVDGDRGAIQANKFIKRSKADIDDEKTMRLLFKLNDDLKGK